MNIKNIKSKIETEIFFVQQKELFLAQRLKPNMNRNHFIVLIFSLLALSLNAQNYNYTLSDDSLVNHYASKKRVYYAERTELKPKIDGKLDDACWQKTGNWQGGFIQQQPNQAKPPSQETEIKILYDNTYLYVAIINYDNEPEKMRPVLGRRDELNGDMAGIAIDSYFDKQTAFEFNLTAAGQKVDIMHLGEYGWDFNWDAVWDGKSTVGDSAWYAEMRIPFSQLRYSNKKEHVWGMHIWRWIDRLKEEDQWKLIPIDAPAMVYIFGELRGIKDIPYKRNFEILPYAKTKYVSDARDKLNYGVGLDGKIGVTSDFTLDYTVNPDFGQVEADPSVLNLTSYEVYYDEKRPFFLEGNNILEYGLSRDLLFYSRRIGQSPEYQPVIGEEETLVYPDQTSILNALKLTGKNREGFSMGIINSMTAKENATIYSGDDKSLEVIEPFTNYFIGRAKQDFNEGKTVLGGMITSTIRNIKAEHLDFLPDNSVVGGLDFQHNWLNRKYFVDAKSFFSRVNGTSAAISDLQLNSRHLFQRNDADHLEYDPDNTSLQGWGGELSGGKRSGKLRLTGSLEWRSPGVDLNDVGYMRQADFIEEEVNLVYRVNKPKGILLSYYFDLEHKHRWSYGGESVTDEINSHARFQFSNLWKLDLLLNRTFNELDTRQLRGGPALRIGGNTVAEFFVQTNTSKNLFFGAGAEFGAWDDKISQNSDYIFHAQWLINNRFNIAWRTSYQKEIDCNQYVKRTTVNESKQYIVGEIHRHTIYSTLRAEIFVTPELSFQYYGSPYASTGDYQNYRRVNESRESELNKRYEQLNIEDQLLVDQNNNIYHNFKTWNPDFNFQEFRSNFVARWEYKTGSTVYFVWTNNRTRYESSYESSILDSFRGISRVAAQNAFMIKISYWFSL